MGHSRGAEVHEPILNEQVQVSEGPASVFTGRAERVEVVEGAPDGEVALVPQATKLTSALFIRTLITSALMSALVKSPLIASD